MERIPVFDGHNDTLLKLSVPEHGGRSFFERGDAGHLDLPRALEGGFGGGFFACWTPPHPESGWTEDGYEVADAPPLDPAYARETADELAKILFRLEVESGGQMEVVRTAENLGPDPGALEDLYEAALRSLGLVWSRPNAYGPGVPFRFPASPDTGPGLTNAGRALVCECNRLGVLLDLSHLNERGFWDVAELSETPLVATHSNAHALCPASRNLTDRQLDAVRDSDGIVGVNFAAAFLREDGKDEEDTPIETVVRHVDYLVERVSIERVGFGSDFDGAKVPRGIGDASRLPKLLGALSDHGYDEAALKKLAHENWVRVLREIWGE